MNHSKGILLLVCLALCAHPYQCCPQPCVCVNGKVNCAGQGLTSLPVNEFPVGMTELDFSNNSLTSLESRALFSFGSSLQILDVSANQISAVALDAFDSLTNVRKLYLQKNRLTSLPEKSFTDLTSVDTLDLSHNPLSGYPSKVLMDTPTLSTLKIVQTGLDQTTFEQMKMTALLINLDISGNNFTHLPYLAFSTYNRLTHLTINDANIQEIDRNAFVGMVALKYLKMTGNQLTHLNRETYQTLESLSYLDINGNQFVCDCGAAQFNDWRNPKGVSLVDGASCRAADGLNRYIKDLGLQEFCTHENVRKCNDDSKMNVLRVRDLKTDRVTLEWRGQSLPKESQLWFNIRPYGVNKQENLPLTKLNQHAGIMTLDGLKAGSPYAVCVLEPHCGLYACVDFTTARDPTIGAVGDAVCITAEVTAGVAAAAAFVTLTVGMLVVYLILRGVCCCPERNKEDYTPPHTPSTTNAAAMSAHSQPSKRTQHVFPMQMSQSYVPTSHVHVHSHTTRVQSTSSIGDTYDAIPLEPIDRDPSGKVFHNPSYRRKERPRNVNDPLPNPETNGSTSGGGVSLPGKVPLIGTSPPRSETPQLIQGISSTYLHPTLDSPNQDVTHTIPNIPKKTTEKLAETYLEPTETLTRRPSSKRTDPKLRHTMNDALSSSDPYHVYQEAMDDLLITDELNLPKTTPIADDPHPSPSTLKKQFAGNKLPSLDDLRKQMEGGTGRTKKFRRPEKSGAAAARSVSTPDILAADKGLRAQDTIDA